MQAAYLQHAHRSVTPPCSQCRHGTQVAVKLLIDNAQAAAAASSGAPLADLSSPLLEKLEAEAELMLGLRCMPAGAPWL